MKECEPSSAGYICKGVTKSSDPESITIWDLLTRYGKGEMESGNLFSEYAHEFRGKQKLRYSPNLAKALAIKEKIYSEGLEVSVSHDRTENKIIGSLSSLEWRDFISNKGKAV